MTQFHTYFTRQNKVILQVGNDSKKTTQRMQLRIAVHCQSW